MPLNDIISGVLPSTLRNTNGAAVRSLLCAPRCFSWRSNNIATREESVGDENERGRKPGDGKKDEGGHESVEVDKSREKKRGRTLGEWKGI